MNNILDIIAIPFGYVIQFFYSFTQSYVLSLFLFALVVKLILFPLSIKQQKNQVKQAKLRPMEMAIRKKYAGRNDKPTQMKMNEEIQKLYSEQNFNPLSGCLPLLIQFPIIIALYQVVINPLRYMCHLSNEVISTLGERINSLGGEFAEMTFNNNYGYIKMAHIIRENIDKFSDLNLTVRDMPNLNVFGGLDLSQTPDLGILKEGFSVSWWLLLIPILTFVVQFASAKIMKKFSYNPAAQANGTSGCIMDIAMPLMSVFFSFIVPAAVAVYWMFQGIVGVLQQLVLVKMFPMPKFTDEEMREAEKTINAQTKKKAKPKSLYNDDDGDYSDYAKELAERYAKEDAEEAAKQAAEEAEKGEESSDPNAPALKDDERKNKKPRK